MNELFQKQYYFTLKGFFKRVKDEYNYYTKRPWMFEEVGKFWDTVEDYDDINETLYPYLRRFTNSYELGAKYLNRNDYEMLDIQARSGKGSLFWYQRKKIKSTVCVDFSDYLALLADRKLRHSGLKYGIVKIHDFPLPFENKSFDFICSYETIEHIYDYKVFFSELIRVLKKDGILILTCPNIAWEWVHWLSVAININHSEGPHRFLRKRELVNCFKDNEVIMLEENSTIFLPFNNKFSITIDKLMEKYLPNPIKSLLGLRRTFILKKY